MSQKIAALLMMFGGSTFSLAQTGETQPTPTQETTPEPAQQTEPTPPPTQQTPAELDAEIESDIANAEIPTEHISAELGFGYRKGPGPELRLSWYREDDQVYGLKIGQYTAKDISHFDTLSLMMVGLQSRFSLEGSFFVESGLDLTQIKATIDEAEKVSTSGTGTYGFEGSVNQVYLQLSFGNQWQTESWTFGVDWVDLYVPFTGSSFSTSSSGDIIDRESRERRNKRDLKTEAWDINYGMSVHGGFVF